MMQRALLCYPELVMILGPIGLWRAMAAEEENELHNFMLKKKLYL